MCDMYCGLKKDRRGGKTELPGLSALFDLKPLHQLFQMGRCCSCRLKGGWWDWGKVKAHYLNDNDDYNIKDFVVGDVPGVVPIGKREWRDGDETSYPPHGAIQCFRVV